MSNIYHVQSIFPSAQTRPDSREQQLVVTVRSPVRGLGQVEELQEMVGGGVEAEGEELFALEGVPPVYSHYSEEEREESEPDEGIHIPAKFREKKLTEVNYNFKLLILADSVHTAYFQLLCSLQNWSSFISVLIFMSE